MARGACHSRPRVCVHPGRLYTAGMKPPRNIGGVGRGPSGGDRGRPDPRARPSQGGKASGGESRGERPRGAAPHGEGLPGGGKFAGNKFGAGKSGGGRPGAGAHGAPHGGQGRDRRQDDRPQGARLQGDRPYADRAAGDRAPVDRPRGSQTPGGFPASRQGENTLRARPPRRDDDAPRPMREHRDQPEHREHRGGDRTGLWLYGTHAVAAALANPARRLRRLLVTEAAEAAIAARLPRPWAITAERAEREQLDRLLGRDAVHQGVALHADPLVAPPLAQALERPGPLLVLDQLADPRNVGAILRSAAALGVACVIVQDRHAPDETGALAKAASGALETMPLLRAVNISRTLVALKAADVFVVGLDAAAPPLSGPALADRRVALVLGAEGEGLRRLTRETCDTLAGIAIQSGGLLDSLNVSAACAIALYELGRR